MSSPAVGAAVLRFQEWWLGRHSFALWNELNDPARPPEALRVARAGRLQALLDHARRRIPAWRERLSRAPERVDPDAPALALAEVPVLTRSEIERELETLWWRETPHKVLKHVSGGSTDDNLEFYLGRERQTWNRAIRWRALSRLGVAPGDPVLHLWPHFPPDSFLDGLKQRVRHVRNVVTNDREFDPRPFTDGLWRQTLDRIASQPGTLLFTFPSWALRLWQYGQRTGTRPEGLRAVCCSGEALYPYQREALRRAWGVPVFEEYGSQETGAIANEDRQGQFWVNTEHVLVEVLKGGQPAAPGELGEVVVTNLTSTLMPFIRYATGDILRQPEPAVGGLPGELGPLCPPIEGRTSDLLLTTAGVPCASRPLVNTLLETLGGELFHLRQQSATECQLHLLESSAGRAELAVGQVRAHLGEATAVTVVVGREFAALRSGKHRFVCSREAARRVAHDQQASDELARIWAQPVISGVPLATLSATTHTNPTDRPPFPDDGTSSAGAQLR